MCNRVERPFRCNREHLVFILWCDVKRGVGVGGVLPWFNSKKPGTKHLQGVDCVFEDHQCWCDLFRRVRESPIWWKAGQQIGGSNSVCYIPGLLVTLCCSVFLCNEGFSRSISKTNHTKCQIFFPPDIKDIIGMCSLWKTYERHAESTSANDRVSLHVLLKITEL